MKKIKQDQVYGASIIIIGIILWVIVSQITPTLGSDPNDVGAKFFPMLLIGGLWLCGLAMIILPDPDSKPLIVGKQWLKALKYFLLLVVYVACLKPIGYLIVTPICMFCLIWMLAETRPKLWLTAVYSIIFSVGVYFIFSSFLQIYLPKGILDF